MEDEPDINKDEIDEAELDMNKIEEDMHKVKNCLADCLLINTRII